MARILVVDDDDCVRSMVVSLGRRVGFDVVEAADGADGLSKAASQAPDLVILDIALPGFDGRDVLVQLRANPATRGLPVVIFTGRLGHRDRIHGLELGADDYVEKPCDVRYLFRTVRRRLEKAGRPVLVENPA